MVDQGFHVFFHGCAGWGGDFVVFDADGAGGHFIETLMYDSERLAEFLHAAEVAVVTIAIHTYRDVELNLIVGVVGLAFSHIPGDAAAAEHDAGEGVVESVGGGNDANAFCPADPDAVVREEFFGFVDAVAELSGPLVDVIEEAEGEVLVDAAGAYVGGVEAGARNAFIEFLG